MCHYYWEWEFVLMKTLNSIPQWRFHCRMAGASEWPMRNKRARVADWHGELLPTGNWLPANDCDRGWLLQPRTTGLVARATSQWHGRVLLPQSDRFYPTRLCVVSVWDAKPARPTQTIQSLQSAQETSDQLDRMLVPIGGGKDSIVALELLRQWRQQSGPIKSGQIGLFAVNPTTAANGRHRNQRDAISRHPAHTRPSAIYPQSTRLSMATPFSAFYSALSVCSRPNCTGTQSQSWAMSNPPMRVTLVISIERSTISTQNRSTTSLPFVSMCQHTCSRNLIRIYPRISLLRPFNELQIAKFLPTKPKVLAAVPQL